MKEFDKLVIHLFKECFTNAKQTIIDNLEESLNNEKGQFDIEYFRGFVIINFIVHDHKTNIYRQYAKTITSSEYNAMLHMFYRF